MSAASPVNRPPSLRWLWWLTVPLALGAIVASAAGVFVPAAYEAETANWAAQGRGQDVANLVLFPALLLLAWRAARGSVRALLGWVGVAAYGAYSYLLYAGWVHFGGLFLVYVAVFGLSVWAVAAGLAVVDPVRLRAMVRPTAPVRAVGAVLAGVGALFGLLWLSEIVPATVDGVTPQTLVDTGLVTNPVWVLDLAIVLPAMVVAGVLLRRGRALGYLLAVPLLAFGAAMGVAILGMFGALAIAGETVGAVSVVMVSLVLVAEVAALARFLAHVRPDATVADVLRQPPTSVEATLRQPTAAGR